jgi:hypothetical protein
MMSKNKIIPFPKPPVKVNPRADECEKCHRQVCIKDSVYDDGETICFECADAEFRSWCGEAEEVTFVAIGKPDRSPWE